MSVCVVHRGTPLGHTDGIGSVLGADTPLYPVSLKEALTQDGQPLCVLACNISEVVSELKKLTKKEDIETALDERIAEMKTAMESEMKSRSQHPRGYVQPAARDLLRAVNAWLGR